MLDLSQVDPTNIFNLFGLIPFDPTTISPFLHLGLWPLIMGAVTAAREKQTNVPSTHVDDGIRPSSMIRSIAVASAPRVTTALSASGA